MKNLLLLIAAIFLATLGSVAAAKKTEFNYQGRLNVQGGPFDGTAEFRFAIVRKDSPTSETVLWVNDGGDTSVLPPAAAVALSVDNGLFVVQIGNTDLTNMVELSPTLFNEDGDLYLRVWVDDGLNGIEQLTPDRKIVLPSVIGMRSHNDLTLYVDPVLGNDKWPGIKPQKPKKTIQAAVDALPVVLEGATVVQLAAGTYHETVQLRNINLSGKYASLTIIGDTTTPENVVLDGENLLGTGILLRGMPADSYIKGLTIENYTSSGISSLSSIVTAQDCIIRYCNKGVVTDHGGVFRLEQSLINDCQWGYDIAGNVWGYMRDTTVSHCHHEGVRVHVQSTFASYGASVIETCGTDGYSYGLRVTLSAYGYLDSLTVQNNNIGGILSMQGSYIQTNTITVTGNPVGVRAYKNATFEYTTSASTISGNTQNTQSSSGGSIIVN